MKDVISQVEALACGCAALQVCAQLVALGYTGFIKLRTMNLDQHKVINY